MYTKTVTLLINGKYGFENTWKFNVSGNQLIGGTDLSSSNFVISFRCSESLDSYIEGYTLAVVQLEEDILKMMRVNHEDKINELISLGRSPTWILFSVVKEFSEDIGV